MTIDLDNLSLRELQKECARVLATIAATNNNLSRFNKEAHHDSQRWYKSVISWYITEHGDLPSKIGPGKDVKLLYDI